VPSSMVEEMHAQLTDAEKALANKQEHIDEMKQEIFQKEKELETISVFQAQVCVCGRVSVPASACLRLRLCVR